MASTTDRGGLTTSLTQAYIGHKTEEIKQEVMGLVGMGDSFQDEDNQGSKSSSNRTLWTSAVLITAAAGFGMNIVTMIFYSAGVVYSMGIITIVLAAAVVFSELQLEDLPTLRQVQNNLREDVNHFARQNIQLKHSVDDLEGNVTRLKGVEQQLRDITHDQELNITKLKGLVAKHKTINDGMKQCIKRGIVSQLIATALQTEKDESGDYDDREIKRLITYMRNLPAVTINEEKLQAALDQTNRSLPALINIIYDIRRGGQQLGDDIFMIDETNKELQQTMIQQEDIV